MIHFLHSFNTHNYAIWCHRHVSADCGDCLCNYPCYPPPASRWRGPNSVPATLHDAGSMSGINMLQWGLKIEIPSVFQHIMLGINQTVVFTLFMVIIGAIIGTDYISGLFFLLCFALTSFKLKRVSQ